MLELTSFPSGASQAPQALDQRFSMPSRRRADTPTISTPMGEPTEFGKNRTLRFSELS
ncbi:hypothetical protein ALQ05_200208 [Pseudomonas amygdali pv. mori]|uniref:Uncharacterized protein n=1 Tax=Pseudomonas amygdali pv. mori TaxID=34065 RepID=A0A3M4L099_PSEA0|nr:hypothetical protein ALQ05_200208 [Pseudomonas amygdali pv. mori]